MQAIACRIRAGASSGPTQVFLRNQEFLEPWLGGLLFAVYGLAFARGRHYPAIRRDVTDQVVSCFCVCIVLQLTLD